MVGTATFSGAYLVSDTAGLKQFFEGYTTSISGANCFIIPAGENKVYVGVFN